MAETEGEEEGAQGVPLLHAGGAVEREQAALPEEVSGLSVAEVGPREEIGDVTGDASQHGGAGDRVKCVLKVELENDKAAGVEVATDLLSDGKNRGFSTSWMNASQASAIARFSASDGLAPLLPPEYTHCRRAMPPPSRIEQPIAS